MNRSEFQALTRKTFEDKILGLSDTKGSDYAGDQDALSNFKESAKTLGLTPNQVWAVYAQKHWSAVMTYIREGDVKSEPVEGRIHDLILYLFLLLGLENEKQRAMPFEAPGEDADT